MNEELRPRHRAGRQPNQGKEDQNTELSAMPSVELNPDEKDRLEKRRRQRKPFGSHQQKLAYPERPGYHRHWFNDIPGRIHRANEAGYDHVLDDKGQPVKRVVGVQEGGGALFAYLMEIPEEWWKEDLDEVQKRVDEMHNAIKQGRHEGSEPGKTYIPNQGITIRTI